MLFPLINTGSLLGRQLTGSISLFQKKLKGLTAQKENTYEIEFNMKLNLSSLLKKRLLINYTRSRPELN